MHYPLRLCGILSARVSLGFGLALAASVATASTITVDFTADNFYSVYGNYSPPQAVVTGSFTVSGDLTQLLAFSMDIAGYHYGLGSGIAYSPYQTSAFACCGTPYLTEGTNSFELSMDPSLIPSGYVPYLAYTSAINNDPTGWMTGSPVTYSLVSSVPEPADVTLMCLGLGLVGFAVSRRRKV